MKKILFTMLGMCCILAAHAQFADVTKGDIIDINGVKAIAFQVDESGEHGMAMTIKCLRGENAVLCNDKKVIKAMPPTLDENNGMANTKAIRDYAEENGLSLSVFPIHDWCAQLGEGWYIPSLNELKAFVNFWLGNEKEFDWDNEDETEQTLDESKPFYKQMNKKMLEAGGIPFLNGVYTSTNTEDGKMYVFNFNKLKNTWSFNKSNRTSQSKYFTGRAVYKF